MKKLESISVVGGGTAGFVSALILKTRFPNTEVKIIRSKKIGIIGVGEGSTEHWAEFMQYIGVPFESVIAYCDATFKSGIMFRGWGETDFLHSTALDHELKNGQYQYVYGKIISENLNKRLMNPELVWDNKVATHRLMDMKTAPFNQYHFNTNKLNEFLTVIAGLKGIPVVDDEITDVVLNESGEIDHLVGESDIYKSDFYIDSTGFKKLLMSKLGGKWNSYGEYLKMKAAIVFPLEDTEEYNIWTVAQAMDYGWMFKIPVWGRSGNGYIFDSDYITPEQAKAEVERFLGHEIEVGKHLTFDPGAIDRPWIKNCCAVGLSASFVEPLEATSIGTSIRQTFLLMHRMPNYDDQTIKEYNTAMDVIMNNIRDFVVLHYMTKKNNTQFWIDVSKLKIPDSLATNLERWRKNLPIEEDFLGTRYILFREGNFIHIMHGLDLFNTEKITHEYKLMGPGIHDLADNTIRELVSIKSKQPATGHKAFIQTIREKVFTRS
jgi:tryptophan halogenase